MKPELDRMARVADLMVSGHSLLRDRYRRRATAIDIALLLFSAIVATLSFASTVFLETINPTDLESSFFISITALAIFLLSLFQMKIDWKGKSSSHADAARSWAKAKLAVKSALSSEPITESDYQLARNEYNYSGEFAIPIPDKHFLTCKSHHLKKVEISKYLSVHPHASPTVVSIKFWVKENIFSNWCK